MKLLIATRNKDKLKEIKDILQDTNYEIISALDFPDLADVVEDRDTIEGNAIKKAVETAKQTNCLTLSDDTGFFIEALNGEPGVLAARFAGEGCTYRDNRMKALQMLEGQVNRKAYFATVVALASPGKLIHITCGKVYGTITETEIGDNGFGYDAIFRADETGKTFGEMPDTEKNLISHRSRALKEMIDFLKK